MVPKRSDRGDGARRSPSPRVFIALIALGAALRLIALPLPGTGDVLIWKTWTYNAVASGETTLYGIGGQPPEHRALAYHSIRFPVDYPPLVLWELGLAGRVYHAMAPGMSDTSAFTALVKLPSVVADVGLAALLYLAGKRLAGIGGARCAALAWWLNPAALLSGATLGYLDPLFALPAVAAVMAAAAGSTWLAGSLIAVSVLTTAQGLIVAPVIVVGVVANTPLGPFGRAATRHAGRVARRLGETAAGGLGAALAIVAPHAIAGSLPNMAFALRTLGEHDMLSKNAANLWWMVTWVLRVADSIGEVGAWRAMTALPRILAISSVMNPGYPDPRLVGLVLTAAAWGWALWQARRARDLSLLAGLGAFLVHAYFVLSAQVHENHLFLAIPLAVLAAIGRRGWARVALVLTAIQVLNLNFFYGFSEGIEPGFAIPRTLTLVDGVVLLSAANCAALFWHGWTLRRETRPEPGSLAA